MTQNPDKARLNEIREAVIKQAEELEACANGSVRAEFYGLFYADVLRIIAGRLREALE